MNKWIHNEMVKLKITVALDGPVQRPRQRYTGINVQEIDHTILNVKCRCPSSHRQML
jgi:hypothetical protein